jgi:hypothetical protein
VQFLAVCHDGTSVFWSGFIPATITRDDNLKSVVVSGSGTVRDISRVPHEVTFR